MLENESGLTHRRIQVSGRNKGGCDRSGPFDRKRGRRVSGSHTWVVCAYGESPYLESCVRSLLSQSVRSRILIATSTPNAMIQGIAERFHLPVYVNEGTHGITQDWNFAVSLAKTRYVTIAHQDDVYEPLYLERALWGLNGARHPLIFFSDYYEIRDGQRVSSNRNLRIKRVMLLPFRIRLLQNSIFVRRRVLSFGSPIDCPSVTYVLPNLPKGALFDSSYRVTQDWEAWERFSKMEGTFVFDPRLLMGHRIHEASTTTELIADQTRTREELSIFQRFWPDKAARWLEDRYRRGQDSNRI